MNLTAQSLVEGAVAAILKSGLAPDLKADDLAVTVLVPGTGAAGHYRGDAPFYPASVIKLFYLAAAHRWLEDQRIADTPELRRALHDMIVHSSNAATGYVVDHLTDTTSGPELSGEDLRHWWEKRQVVNRYFQSLGYLDVNAGFKTWDEGPFGRDQQAVEQFSPNRNRLTTKATARLLAEMALGGCVSAERSRQMMKLTKRDVNDPRSTDDQAREFIGRGLPATAQLWSKAGDTSQVRHDAALVGLPGRPPFVMVIFTNRPDCKAIIPELARRILVDGKRL